MIDQSQKVKIIATLGPASTNGAILKNLVKAGVNLFRLNFSHGAHDFHEQNIKKIREIEMELGLVIGIIGDLQGPKLRVGEFESETGIILKEGQTFTLDLNNVLGTQERVQFPHAEIYSTLEKGHEILLVDGKIRLVIEKSSVTSLITKVLVGGPLSDHQGVNVPGVALPLSALTPKDKVDLDFMLKCKIDYVALSFVQRPNDLIELQDITKGQVGIISKIEKPQALEHLEEIIRLSDAIMVARGDLGVECPPETVPSLQRQIINECRNQGKPVIVATQMLESMIQNPSPTRAEASDVATAVYEGADCVMLSGESAVGKYPILAVEMMHKIIMSSMASSLNFTHSQLIKKPLPISDALASAANQIAHDIEGKLIVTFTATGLTALRAAYKRPSCPILAITPSEKTAHRLTLVWGVIPKIIDPVEGTDALLNLAMQEAKKLSFLKKDSKILITFGVPFNKTGTTNTLHVGILK